MLFSSAAFAAAFAVGWVLFTLELMPWRRTAGAHWTLRARALSPVRVAAGVNPWAIAIVCALAGEMAWPGRWLPILAGGFFGASLSGYGVSREISPEISFKRWLHLFTAFLVFRGLRWGTFAAAFWLMPAEPGLAMAALALGYLAVHISLHFGLVLRLQAILGLLRPASPRLQRIIADAQAEHGGEVRAVWEMEAPEANAYAFIGTRDLVFTRGLLDAAPDDELRAIGAHELAHLAESRWALAARIVGGLAVFPVIFFTPMEVHFGTNGLVALVVSGWLIWWLHARFYHAREKHADHVAARSTPDPAVYARGLERIYRLNRWPAVQRKSRFNPYPDLYDRMIAAGVMPDYPRPAPPPARAWSSNLLLLAATWLGLQTMFGH